MTSIAWWPTVVVLGIATVTDLRNRRIPNWLVVPFLLAGLLASTGSPGGIGIGRSLAGAALAAVLSGAIWFLRGMGMGDVKLLTAVGAWVGPSQMTTALVITGMAGGFLAIIWAARKGSLGASLDGAADLVCGSWNRGFHPHPTLALGHSSARAMPYAPAIAIGTIFSFFSV